MINPKVSSAVAAVLALGAAAGAGAVDISTVPAANILYVSGSTAIDPALVAYFVNSTDLVCDGTQPGGIDVYTGVNSGGKFVAVACVAGASVTGAAGQSIAMIKEDNAGSLNGIQPIDTPTANSVSFPVSTSLTTAAAACGAGTVTSPVPTGEQQQTLHSCGTYSVTTSTAASGPYSNVGFADVEAAIFGQNPTNTTAISTVDVPFAIAASLGLYHALQQAQGITPGDSTAIPSLARSQVAALLNGTISSWNEIAGENGVTSPVGAQHVVFGNSHLVGTANSCYDGTAFSTAADCQGTAPSVAVAPANTNVYICYRGQSSGTQQTAQIFFGNIGCASGVKNFAPPSKPGGTCAAAGCSWATSTYGNALVFAGNGTGDDLSCLEAHDGEGHFAIGIASNDQAWGTAQSTTDRRDFRFIGIDGVAPSIENAAAGRYTYWAQSAGYFPSSTSAVNYPTGAVAKALLTHLTSGSSQIGTPGSALAINSALERTGPTFDGGILTIPSNSAGGTPAATPSTGTLAQFRANPVNAYIKNSPSNNCQSAYLAPSSPPESPNPTWAVP